MSTTIDFAGEKTLPALLKMSLPMMAATFLSMAYNLVDSLWIGNLLGEEAMAALTSSTPVILLLNAIAMGTAGGGSILLSQAVGAEDRAARERLLSTSFFASLGLCLLLTAGSEALLPLLLRGLGTPADILPLARDYLAVYLLGYLSVFLYNYFAAVLRSYGNTAFQAIAMLLCTLLNAVLDPLFIHWLGFSGAAVATVTSQMTALAIMLVYLARKRLFSCHIRQFDRGLLLSLCRSALPSVVQQGVPAVSTAFLTGLVSGYGVSAIAGYGVACKLEVVLLYPAVSLNMARRPLSASASAPGGPTAPGTTCGPLSSSAAGCWQPSRRWCSSLRGRWPPSSSRGRRPSPWPPATCWWWGWAISATGSPTAFWGPSTGRAARGRGCC